MSHEPRPLVDWSALGSGWTEPPLSDAELDALAYVVVELGEPLSLEQQVEIVELLAYYRRLWADEGPGRTAGGSAMRPGQRGETDCWLPPAPVRAGGHGPRCGAAR